MPLRNPPGHMRASVTKRQNIQESACSWHPPKQYHKPVLQLTNQATLKTPLFKLLLKSAHPTFCLIYAISGSDSEVSRNTHKLLQVYPILSILKRPRSRSVAHPLNAVSQRSAWSSRVITWTGLCHFNRTLYHAHLHSISILALHIYFSGAYEQYLYIDHNLSIIPWEMLFCFIFRQVIKPQNK